MKSKICEHCHKIIDINSDICNFCGKQQTSPEVIIIAVILFIVMIILGIYAIFTSPYNKTYSSKEITSWTCTYEMKKEISNQYKSPSTVKFIKCNWSKNEWIYWEADAQNWFWAIVRTNFVCGLNSNYCVISQK